MHQRYQSGDEHSGGEVDEYGIGRDAADIASQLAGYHGARCRCGTYEADHGPFEHYPQAAAWHCDQRQGYGSESSALQQQKP